LVAKKLLGLFAKSIKRVELHELTKTYEIDGKYHVQPSVGPNKGKTLKVFNTEAEANAWAKKRSNMTPKQKKIAKQAPPANKITGADFKAMREYEKKSMVGRLDEAKSGMTMGQRMKKTRANEEEPTATMAYGMGKKKKPKAVMYGGGMGKKPKMAVMTADNKKKTKEEYFETAEKLVGGKRFSDYPKVPNKKKKKGPMAAMPHMKKKGPMAAMPGYHMQKRDKY